MHPPPQRFQQGADGGFHSQAALWTLHRPNQSNKFTINKEQTNLENKNCYKIRTMLSFRFQNKRDSRSSEMLTIRYSVHVLDFVGRCKIY